jgi:hypothetical protein
MIRISGILKFDGFEPGILPRRLVKMAVNANVSFHEGQVTQSITLGVDFSRIRRGVKSIPCTIDPITCGKTLVGFLNRLGRFDAVPRFGISRL